MVDEAFARKKTLRLVKTMPLEYERQYLYPEMVFSCNGTVTKWIYAATASDHIVSSQVMRLPEFQIWRETSPNAYKKIGSSSVNGDNKIGAKLYVFIPQPPLQFQEGDIFGIYVPNRMENPLKLYTQDRNGPLNQIFHSRNSLKELIDKDLLSTQVYLPYVTAEISKYYVCIINAPS